MALFAIVGRVVGASVVNILAEENSVIPIPPGIAERTPSSIPAERMVRIIGVVSEIPNAVMRI